MAKSDLVGLLLFILMIEVCMYVFLGVTTPFTSLYDLIASGSVMSLNSLWVWLGSNFIDIIGALGLGAIIIGSTLTGKADFVVYAGITAVLASYALVISDLYSRLTIEFNTYSSLSAGGFFAFLIVAPIMILYIVTILKFWRGTD
jgi:hypothetical protein